MGSITEEQMKVVVLIRSISMATEYSVVTAAECTLREDDATREYVSIIFIEEQKR